MVSKELIGASTRPLILSILSRGENYGYAIIKEVERLSDGHLKWTDGMLYPVLHRLQKQGLIQSRWRVAETGRRRKYYRLSTKGQKSLQGERTQWLAVHATLSKLWGTSGCPTSMSGLRIGEARSCGAKPLGPAISTS